jgi:hypothetical protein
LCWWLCSPATFPREGRCGSIRWWRCDMSEFWKLGLEAESGAAESNFSSKWLKRRGAKNDQAG